MQTIIRPEEPRDAEAIELVTIQAFENAPHTDHTEQFIVRELRLAGALTVSLVAETNGQIMGHVAISPVRRFESAMGLQAGTGWVLSPLLLRIRGKVSANSSWSGRSIGFGPLRRMDA